MAGRFYRPALAGTPTKSAHGRKAPVRTARGTRRVPLGKHAKRAQRVLRERSERRPARACGSRESRDRNCTRAFGVYNSPNPAAYLNTTRCACRAGTPPTAVAAAVRPRDKVLASRPRCTAVPTRHTRRAPRRDRPRTGSRRDGSRLAIVLSADRHNLYIRVASYCHPWHLSRRASIGRTYRPTARP